MVTIFIRTVLIYLFLTVTMRLCDKRQIGELEVTDFVVTLLLSEIASLPIVDQNVPIAYAVIPMVTLLCFEVFSSYILVRHPRLKGLVSARPTVLIRNGKIDPSALAAARISAEELLCGVRQQGLTDLAQVSDAILEKNGTLTVLPRPEFAPPTAGQLGLAPEGEGLMHVVFGQGVYNDAGLALIGRNRAWLDRELSRRGLDKASLFCVTANREGSLFWVLSEEGKAE